LINVRKIASLACAAALGFGAVGCGSESANGADAPGNVGTGADAAEAELPQLDPVAAVRGSADKTRDAGTSRLEMAINATAQGQQVDITTEGAFDYRKNVGELELNLPSGTGLGDGTIREIIAQDALYMSGIPGVPEGKWVKMSVDELNVGDSSGLMGNDPAAVLELVRGASDDVKEVGTAEVRGERTTHYRGTLDLDEAVANAPAEARDRVKQYLERAGATSVPFDLYVDDAGRLRKLVQRFELDPPGGAGSVDMKMTLEMYDYGAEVNVEEPSSADVIEAPGGLGGG
jgi:hypothetical protein